MENLKKDLLDNIEYLKNHGKCIDIDNISDTEKLFLTSRYNYKTKRVIKDIISIIQIDKSLKSLIPINILNVYFKDYIIENI